MKTLSKLAMIGLASAMVIGCQPRNNKNTNGNNKKEMTQDMTQKEQDLKKELSREGRMAFEKMTAAERAEVMKLVDQGVPPDQAVDRIEKAIKQKMNGNGKKMNGNGNGNNSRY